MGQAVVSRLRDVLDEQSLDIGDLQRRLQDRGVRVGRRALNRLVSDRPLQDVNLTVLLPLLEELQVDLPTAFQLVDAAPQHESLHEPKARAGRAGKRRAAIAEADRALDIEADRLEAELRVKVPELFDVRGRLRLRAYQQWVLARTGGKRYLTSDEIAALPRPQ